MAEGSHTITVLLEEWRSGKQDAANQLMELVYAELHRIAAREMRRERREHTLQATALVHEAYLRLSGGNDIDFRDRAHFFAVAARQLRRILVDYARRGRRVKRGGGERPLELLDGDGIACNLDDRVLALNEALEQLEALDPRAAQVIELRYFAGLSEIEAAAALDISITTLKRDWDFARTWLTSRLR